MTRKLDHTTPKGLRQRLKTIKLARVKNNKLKSKTFLITDLLGDHSAIDPPVPIPNTEVKCSNADGSATYDCARVGHRQA